MKEIKAFRGIYACFSNFISGYVEYEGMGYENSEAAFQAAKTLDLKERERFTCMSPAKAKREGGKIALRSDWEEVKYQVMYDVVKDKFSRNERFKDILVSTGDAHIEEANHHGDMIWGTVDGVGTNWLGEILMKVRDELR